MMRIKLYLGSQELEKYLNKKVQANLIKLKATTPDATIAKVNINKIGVIVIP
mgnify:CR=1 FL=1